MVRTLAESPSLSISTVSIVNRVSLLSFHSRFLLGFKPDNYDSVRLFRATITLLPLFSIFMSTANKVFHLTCLSLLSVGRSSVNLLVPHPA